MNSRAARRRMGRIPGLAAERRALGREDEWRPRAPLSCRRAAAPVALPADGLMEPICKGVDAMEDAGPAGSRGLVTSPAENWRREHWFYRSTVRGLTLFIHRILRLFLVSTEGGGFPGRGMLNSAVTPLTFVARNHRLWLPAVWHTPIGGGLVLQGRTRGR